jgi:hypothetical protein
MQNAQKSKKWENFELLRSRLSIFPEKILKSGRRGGAEFGTHDCKKNEFLCFKKIRISLDSSLFY